MRRVGRLLVVVALVSLAPATSAHIVTEPPWHPLAYAYRTAVFLSNLRPTDWGLIERTFTVPAGPGAPGGAATQYLVALDEVTGAVQRGPPSSELVRTPGALKSAARPSL